jgi:hypothetical protein
MKLDVTPKSIAKYIAYTILLFLLMAPAVKLVNIINELTYTLTMNSESLFDFISFFSLFFITTVFFLICLFIISKITNKILLNITKVVIFIVPLLFVPSALLNFVGGMFTYESCGEEFNNEYIAAAVNQDYSFCFKNDTEPHYYISFKGEPMCRTPNKDYLRLVTLREDIHYKSLEDYRYLEYTTTCISSFASYVDNIRICDSLEVLNEQLSNASIPYDNNSAVVTCVARVSRYQRN